MPSSSSSTTQQQQHNQQQLLDKHKHNNALVIGVCGGSGSGKTTFAQRLVERLGVENVNMVSHDWYYRDLHHLTLAQRALTNFDHPDSLETTLMVQHVQQLRRGQSVAMPVYDFAQHARDKSNSLMMHPKPIILIEGILVFADVGVRAECDIKVFVDVDADVRVLRRLQRDVSERGRTVEDGGC